MANDVLTQWIKPQVKDLAAMTEWSVNVGPFAEFEFSGEDAFGPLRMGIMLDIVRGRFMEKRLGKIEADTKGLGEAVIHWITRAGYHTIDVMTPAYARDLAEYLWWHGESDEESWKENLDDEGYEPDDIESMIGPAKFEASFPRWVLKPAQPKLSRIKPKTADGKKVLNILREMEAISEKHALLPCLLPDSHDRVYWGAYLGWREEGCAVYRLLDDHFEMANQGGDYMTELNGVEAIPLEAEAFKKWKCRMEKGFRMLNLLDQLILLTTEEM